MRGQFDVSEHSTFPGLVVQYDKWTTISKTRSKWACRELDSNIRKRTCWNESFPHDRLQNLSKNTFIVIGVGIPKQMTRLNRITNDKKRLGTLGNIKNR